MQVRSGQVRSGEFGAGHPRLLHRRAGQIEPGQHPADDLDAVEGGLAGHYPLRVDVANRRSGQFRSGQVRAVERGPRQGGPGEDGAA